MNIKRTVSRTGLQIKKHSPEILLVTGLVGVVGTVYLAVKAGKKVDTTLAEFEERKPVQYGLDEEHNETESVGELHPEDKKELITQIALDVAPAVGLGIISIGCICASYGIINKRLVLVSGALGTTTDRLNQYRLRVKEEYGEEAEDKLFNVSRQSRETVTDDGEVIIEDFEVLDGDHTGGAFRFFYDDASSQFSHNDPEYNKLFLDSKEKMFNELLLANGHVFLNDVLVALDIPKVPVGQLVGWTDCGGNIDFGLYKGPQDMGECVLLNFNVQGYIYNQI